MQEFYPDLIHALSVFAVGVVLLVAKAFRDRALASYHGEEKQRHEAALDAAVKRAVDYFEQTTVPRLKKAAADGSINADELAAELRQVKEDASSMAESMLTEETIGYFDDNSARIDAAGVIDIAAEAYLAQKKGQR
jgi:hypothetical protein